MKVRLLETDKHHSLYNSDYEFTLVRNLWHYVDLYLHCAIVINVMHLEGNDYNNSLNVSSTQYFGNVPTCNNVVTFGLVQTLLW